MSPIIVRIIALSFPYRARSLSKECLRFSLGHSSVIGMSMGVKQLKWLHLKEQDNHRYGTNKNEYKVCR